MLEYLVHYGVPDNFFHQNPSFTTVNPPFVRLVYIAATSSLVLLLNFLIFVTKSKEVSLMLFVLIWHLGFRLSYHHNVVFVCLFYTYFHGKYFSELSFFVSQYHEFMCSTRMATRSHHFTAKTAECNCKFDFNNFFIIVLTCETLFRFLTFLLTTVFQT